MGLFREQSQIRRRSGLFSVDYVDLSLHIYYLIQNQLLAVKNRLDFGFVLALFLTRFYCFQSLEDFSTGQKEFFFGLRSARTRIFIGVFEGQRWLCSSRQNSVSCFQWVERLSLALFHANPCWRVLTDSQG